MKHVDILANLLGKTLVPATLICDFYKVSHKDQYPEGTELLVSNWTPRGSRLEGIDKVVSFGVQSFVLKYVITYFEEHFFSRPLEEVIAEYVRTIKYTLNVANPDYSHIVALHKKGYLPIRVKTIKEGRSVPLRVPMLTIENEGAEFFWVTNYLETIMSCELWTPMNSATVAKSYREILESFAMETVGNTDFVPLQGHDFSMRGMSSMDSAILSGMGHLTAFAGTDTIPAIHGCEAYYGSNIETELVGCSIPASEHSISSSNIENHVSEIEKELEDGTFKPC